MLTKTIAWSFALLAGFACQAQQKARSTPASVDLLPSTLKRDRPARDAREQKRWDEGVFAFYKVDVPGPSYSPSTKVILNTRSKRMYKTRLRELLHQPANFAGAAVADKIGCGTSCFSIGIVDPRNGNAYLLEDLSSANVYLRADFRKNSRALHVMGYMGREPAADRWYVLDEHQLRLVYRKTMKEECFDVGEFEDLWSSSACNFIANTAEPEPLLH